MINYRVIPCLLLTESGLVKTIGFKKKRYIGDPINAVRIFNEKEVDELVLLDIEASSSGRGPNFDLISAIANECFMPFAYGGGIKSIVDADKLFRLGAEKVIIGSSLLETPHIVEEVCAKYGAQSIILSINVTRNLLGRYKIYNPANSRVTKLDPIMFCQQFNASKFGEILLTSVDRDGSRKGYDHKIIELFSNSFNCPIIANGGANSINDFKDAIRISGASAVAAGSLFVYHGERNAILISYPSRTTLHELLGPS